ncbi:MAG: hypothetical protein FJ280_23325, partial [Planctomycetes bacterium]|nr:hypothetical protein [Planctomycetota bacterium]
MSHCADLKSLLVKAKKAAKSASPGEIKAVQVELRQFANQSPPVDVELQDIAVNTIIDLGPAPVVDVTDLILQRYKSSRKPMPPADDPIETELLLEGHRYGYQCDFA